MPDVPTNDKNGPTRDASGQRRVIRLVATAAHAVAGVPRLLIIGFLLTYRTLISPLYGQTCRFYPSCSQYALTAVQRHGAVRGTWLAGRRLLRCHPWNPGGIDHVPPAVNGSRCEHRTPSETTEPARPAQDERPMPPGTVSAPQVDRPLGPPDLNCAPSAPRRAA